MDYKRAQGIFDDNWNVLYLDHGGDVWAHTTFKTHKILYLKLMQLMYMYYYSITLTRRHSYYYKYINLIYENKTKECFLTYNINCYIF